VVNRVEAGVSPVNRIKERQDVNAGEQALELVSEQGFQAGQISAQSIRVGYQLHRSLPIRWDSRIRAAAVSGAAALLLTVPGD
jgi:hypothetical protein